MSDKEKNIQPSSEELEIIELDDRLDLTIDPLVTFVEPPNTNCHNTGCC